MNASSGALSLSLHVDALELAALGFDGVIPQETGHLERLVGGTQPLVAAVSASICQPRSVISSPPSFFLKA
jgi:hypothetical protein